MTSRGRYRTQTRGIPQTKFLEPAPRAQDVTNLDSHWTTTLPEDLLKAIGLQLFYAVGIDAGSPLLSRARPTAIVSCDSCPARGELWVGRIDLRWNRSKMCSPPGFPRSLFFPRQAR